MKGGKRSAPDPLAGIYPPILLQWWHDPGLTAPDGDLVSHYRRLEWALMSGSAAADDLEHLRHCFARVVDGQRSRWGMEERLCVCAQLPDDLEAASSGRGAHGDPRIGLASTLVDLRSAANALIVEGLRWPQTRRILVLQRREHVYDAYRTRLEAGVLPRFFGTTSRPPSEQYVWALMAYRLGWRGQCSWPNEIRRLEYAQRQQFNGSSGSHA